VLDNFGERESVLSVSLRGETWMLNVGKIMAGKKREIEIRVCYEGY